MLGSSKGFTILEAMIALVILSIALLALLRVMPMGLKASKLGEDLTTATLLAQMRMEEIKRGGYANIPNETSESIAPGYDARYEWQAISSGSDPKEVTVSVWWPYKAGSDHSGQRCAHLTTLMANYD